MNENHESKLIRLIYRVGILAHMILFVATAASFGFYGSLIFLLTAGYGGYSSESVIPLLMIFILPIIVCVGLSIWMFRLYHATEVLDRRLYTALYRIYLTELIISVVTTFFLSFIRPSEYSLGQVVLFVLPLFALSFISLLSVIWSKKFVR